MNLHFLDQLQKFKPMSDFQKSPFKQKYALISCAGVAILAAFGGYGFVNLNQQIAQQNTTIAELKSLLESARNIQVPLPTENPVGKNSVAQETPGTAYPDAPSAAQRAREKLKSMGIDASQYTPLLLEAARNGDVERLRLLVDAKAFVNSVDNEGRTVIYSAAREGHAECVKVLLSVPGVDVNKANQNGRTPLNVAAGNGHAECVKLLLSAPAVDVNKANQNGWTPLNAAASNGYAECVKMLLSAPGVDVNMTEEDGCTPLYVAVKEGHIECVNLLLSAPGVDVNRAEKSSGNTPLHCAVREKHYKCVEALLSSPETDVNAVDKYGSTVLKEAACAGDAECVRLLLNLSKIPIDLYKCSGNTPLISAELNHHEECVRLLRAAGARR